MCSLFGDGFEVGFAVFDDDLEVDAAGVVFLFDDGGLLGDGAGDGVHGDFGGGLTAAFFGIDQRVVDALEAVVGDASGLHGGALDVVDVGAACGGAFGVGASGGWCALYDAGGLWALGVVLRCACGGSACGGSVGSKTKFCAQLLEALCSDGGFASFFLWVQGGGLCVVVRV